MLLVSQLVIVGLVQSSIVLINHGAAAHTLDWYEDDDLEGVRFNYKIQEDLAQDGQLIQYSPFTSSRWQSPIHISSQSSAQTPGGTQIGVARTPAIALVQQPTVSRSQSVSSSSSVVDSNNINKALGVAFGRVPSFKRIFKPQNSISKYDSKYDSKENKNSFHSIHKSITSSSPTMSVSIVRRVGSYEHVPINLFNNFGFSKSVSFSNAKNIINTPAPLFSLFSQNLNIQPVDAKEDNDDSSEKHNSFIKEKYLRDSEEKDISTPVRAIQPVDAKEDNDDSSEKHNSFIKEKYLRDSEEKDISTPVRARFVPTLAFLRPVIAPRPVANFRYQLRQQLSTTENVASTIASTTQAPILATYKPIFKFKDNTQVKSLHIQPKTSEENDENSKERFSSAFTRSKQPIESPKVKTLDEEKEDSKETARPAFTRSKHPAESVFADLLKRQSKPLSRFRYQHVLAISGEDD